MAGSHLSSVHIALTTLHNISNIIKALLIALQWKSEIRKKILRVNTDEDMLYDGVPLSKSFFV